MSRLLENFRTNASRRITQLGWSQAEVARKMGTHQTSVNQWLKGKKDATLETVERFSIALGISVVELLGASPASEPIVIERPASYQEVALAAAQEALRLSRASSNLDNAPDARELQDLFERATASQRRRILHYARELLGVDDDHGGQAGSAGA